MNTRPGPTRRDDRPARGRLLTLVKGLPALVIGLTIVALPLASNVRRSTTNRYEIWAYKHRERGEYPALLVCLKRVLAADPWRPEIIYYLAETYDALGESAKAEGLARSLAPEDQTGYAPARRWLTVRGMSGPAKAALDRPEPAPEPPASMRVAGLNPPTPTPEVPAAEPEKPGKPPGAGTDLAEATSVSVTPTPAPADPAAKDATARAGEVRAAATLRKLREARRGTPEESEAQLLQLLRDDPESAEAKISLGLVYVDLGRHLEAVRLIEPLAGNYPALQLVLAKSFMELKNPDGWHRSVKAARELAGRVVAGSPDDPRARSVFLTACLAQGDYEGALATLSKAGTEESAAARRRESAYVCAVWADVLNRSGGKTPAVMKVIERGLGFDPSNELLLTDLAGMIMAPKPDAARVARSAVLGMLVTDGLKAPAHYALGMEAWAKGRPADARTHWSAGYGLNPEMTLLANNYASCLIASFPPEPIKALAVIDGAVARSKADPRLRLTRGQVLAKLGRWADALAELERARKAGLKGEELRKALDEAVARAGGPGRKAAGGPGI